MAAAFGVDDRAAPTVAASPSPLSRRRTTRLVLVVAGGVAVAASASLAIAALGGSGDLPLARVLLVEAIGMQLAAIVCALLLGGDRGACVFAGSLLGSLVVQQRFPDYALFPLAPGGPGWQRAGFTWTAIAPAPSSPSPGIPPAGATGPAATGERSSLGPGRPGGQGSRSGSFGRSCRW